MRWEVVFGASMKLHHEFRALAVSIFVIDRGAIGEPPYPPTKSPHGHQGMLGSWEKGHVLRWSIAFNKVGPIVPLHDLSGPR